MCRKLACLLASFDSQTPGQSSCYPSVYPYIHPSVSLSVLSLRPSASVHRTTTPLFALGSIHQIVIIIPASSHLPKSILRRPGVEGRYFLGRRQSARRASGACLRAWISQARTTPASVDRSTRSPEHRGRKRASAHPLAYSPGRDVHQVGGPHPSSSSSSCLPACLSASVNAKGARRQQQMLVPIKSPSQRFPRQRKKSALPTCIYSWSTGGRFVRYPSLAATPIDSIVSNHPPNRFSYFNEAFGFAPK